MSDFATTQWTLVWEAAREDSTHGRPALTELVQRYWHPLYAFARKRGMSPHDAEDATQEFLSQIVSGKFLEDADPAKGRFRAFLLTAWKRFLIDNYRRDAAAKRGGTMKQVSIDAGMGEKRWLEIESREPDPDRMFMKVWADSLIEESKQRLRLSYAERDKAAVADALLPQLTQTLAADDYGELANQMGFSTSAVKVALHRLRQRFGQTLREVVAETLEDAADIDAELSELLSALRSCGPDP